MKTTHSNKSGWSKLLSGTAVLTSVAALIVGISAQILPEPAASVAPSIANRATLSTPAPNRPLSSSSGQVLLSDLQTAPVAGSTKAAQVIVANRHAAKVLPANIELAGDFIPNNAAGLSDNAPFSRINLPEIASGQHAIDLLGDHLPAVAAWYGYSSAHFIQFVLNDATVHIDHRGRVLHIDGGVAVTDHNSGHGTEPAQQPIQIEAGASMTENADTATAGVGATTGAPFPLDQTFLLHTRSKSNRVIYLNFKGEGSKPAFDLDKNPGTFSTTEQQMIQRIWLRVAEDFAAFDVDITTERPASVTGKTGVTILITNQKSDAGGYAYLNSFSTLKLTAPAFCFQNNLANAEKPIAECLSHEVGHTLGLRHQGDAKVTYYGGGGTGDTGWAPIMGSSYYKNLTQWAKGEYAGANNKEDAYAVMLKQGLSPRTDDHGNVRTAATALTANSANGLSNLAMTGMIEKPGDVDYFSFTAGLGALNIRVTPSAWSGNLDVSVQLMDSSGKVISTTNPLDKLDATLTTNIATAGTYYLAVKGTGKGNPAAVDGYSNYGSIGQYKISGSAPLSVAAKAPVAVIKTDKISGTGPLQVNFDASGSSADGSKIASVLWTFGDGTASATTSTAKYTYSKAGSFKATLKITNAAGLSNTKDVTITVSAAPTKK
jgi:PKD domain